MSHHPFGSGNRSYGLDSAFNERAGPRMPGRWYKHPVIPISSTDAPHYAQASHLYPMRTNAERDNTYRYRPGSLGDLHGSGQPVIIPVLHHGTSRSTSDYGDGSSQSDSLETNIRSPSYKSSSTISASNWPSNRNAPPMNDPEAEVDALTNLLMQSMETRSSNSTTGTLMSGLDGITSSPAGSLKRTSGSNSQLGRLQQHVGLGYGSGMGINGRGSPLTTGNPLTNNSRTNSPTEMSPTTYNNTGSNATNDNQTGNLNIGQNNCFRCRRSLIPLESATLGSTNASSNVITLTGALGVKLHVACFTCYRCAAPLRPDAYYHNLRRLLCPTCVRDGAVETCSNCHRPIGDRVIHALGLPYHPNCFVCVVCAGRLDSRPFTIDVHHKLHCLNDFHRRYAPKCSTCGQPIVPEPGCQEARRVVSGNANYHLDCFNKQSIQQTSGIKSTNYKITNSVAG